MSSANPGIAKTLSEPDPECWCVMHTEPELLCDYEFFDTESDALAYAHGIIAHSVGNGVCLGVYVMRVYWSTGAVV